MANLINGSDHGILNWDSSTRVPPNAEPSSPVVSLASASLITSCSWQTLSTLSSDHLPFLIRLQMKMPSNTGLRRTCVMLKKANWDSYSQEVESALSMRSLPNAKEMRTSSVQFYSKQHHIPNGRHRLHEEPVPTEIPDMMTSIKETPPYLRGRQANTYFRGVKSTSRKVNIGPQKVQNCHPRCSAFTLSRPTDPAKQVCYADDFRSKHTVSRG